MSVIVELTIPVEDFLLGDVLSEGSDIRIHLEHVVPIEDSGVPYFRIQDDTLERIEEALLDASDIASYEMVDTIGDEALVRVEWAGESDGLINAIVASNAAVLQAVGYNGIWDVELRFDTHEDLTAFYHQCVERGISLTLKRMHNPGLPNQSGLGFSLTERQRETLLKAFEEGYFEIPRRMDLVELADVLGISDTAVSQRLRRGITALLATTLSEATEPDREPDADAESGLDT
ncbi:helix-turn-helix domain-containing protein [Halalkalicoccus sp. NIPERK01]|uniref:helix-turn-helix domain-containing protein n=1 Tax=Halalkalicoccus sp. NIPERK01 TaxID=3053469 RepID=UPI00256F4ADD|nr:helix-turn-helix domain-containing protein [Halalkalicoccus sp. NIPERK01]MDL5362538.1 helix-turn-helix domain-containing protein [Halalkalicoccus sp. NIPERK01]